MRLKQNNSVDLDLSSQSTPILKLLRSESRHGLGRARSMQGWALGAHGLPSRGRRAVLATTDSRACCRTDGPGPLEGSTRPAARAAPAAPRSSPQQPCRSGCSGSVPFTEKRTITGISPGSTTIHPQKREGALYIYIKRQGFFPLLFFPPNPAFNQKNKA